jgi:DNA-binding SARP family transcriptional activator
MLLLEANRVVSIDSLIDAVWADSPPTTARKQIQICVSSLRQSFREIGLADVVVTCAPGYLLRVKDGDLDLYIFDRLVADARELLTQSRPREAVDMLRRALTMWRGRALLDVTENSVILQSAAVGIDERRLNALEECLDVELRLGRHREIIHELRDLVARHSTRERLVAQLMTALYHAGRQAEALHAYRAARQTMIDELGLEPGEGLRTLEQDILLQNVAPEAANGGEPAPASSTYMVYLPSRRPDIPASPQYGEIVAALIFELSQATEPGSSTVTISGGTGQERTTLASRFAQDVSNHFPDGRLHGVLGGHRTPATSPKKILEGFLRSLGMPTETIPESLEECEALYGHLLAGQRAIVVLDDVADESQVWPLLPSRTESLVVVTSRYPLAGLPDSRSFQLSNGITISLGRLFRPGARDRVYRGAR